MKKHALLNTCALIICFVCLALFVSGCNDDAASTPKDDLAEGTQTPTDEPTVPSEKPTEEITEATQDPTDSPEDPTEEPKYEPNYPEWIHEEIPEIDASKYATDTSVIGKSTTVQSFEYKDNGNGTYSILPKGDFDAETLIIPSSYNGKPTVLDDYVVFSQNYKNVSKLIVSEGITHIGAQSFWSLKTLEHVILPTTLKSIGEGAFAYCDSIVRVKIPEGVEKIDSTAFYDCNSLKGVWLPSTLREIGSSAFYSCNLLTDIIIPDGVTIMGGSLFRFCENLKTIYLPPSITEKTGAWFGDCTVLTRVRIPNGTTTLYKSEFFNCQYLAEISIPTTVTTIEEKCFAYCVRLKNIYFLGTVEQWNNIEKIDGWNEGTKSPITVTCSDGTVEY